MTVAGVVEALDRARAPYELLRHDHTETAGDEARALGLALEEVAKTVVVETAIGSVRAVLPAGERLDLHKLRGALRIHGKPRLATEAELGRDYPEFELGSVPPLGGAHADRVVVDVRVAAQESVVLEAGTHEESVRLRPADLLALTDATVADLCC